MIPDSRRPEEEGLSGSAADEARMNRTWLCTVMFTDIISYSTASTDLQTQIKARFNAFLGEALEPTLAKDLIILDTGDGAAVCFLADPEDALFSALTLREKLMVHQKLQRPPRIEVRIGVNLGPVRVVRDINGNLNAIGDGINTAQRVMSFAGPNEVLVSRSFFEVVGCIKEEYGQLFEFGGLRRDKHVREHSVYYLRAPAAGAVPPAEPETMPAPVAVVPALTLSEPVRRQIEQELAELIGPLARVLIAKVAAASGSPQEFVAKLSEQIPDPSAQQRFQALIARLVSAPGPAQPPDSISVPLPAAAAAPAADAAAIGHPTVSAKGPSENNLSPAWIDSVTRLLSDSIGPVARVVVKRSLSSISDRATLIDRLAQEIESPADRAAFVQQAHLL